MKNDTTTPPATTPAPRQFGGRVWKSLMGLLLIGVGSIFVQYLWNAYQRAAKMDAWIEVPCTIVSMDVDDEQLNQRGMPKYVF